MDNGAHFHRCDFQVHSPRDRQWGGSRPSSESERQSYAAEFVAACRAKGIGAVAITDHHDMAFIPYIREAAASELDSFGTPVSDESRLVVFPGMELTLGVPCQALLLFDAAFPQDLFSLATTALAIVPAPHANERTAETTRLDRLTSLQAVHDELDKHGFLKGRYIILPNVSDGGTSTILRSGHSGHYREMPCVGGYLDGGVDQLGDGNLRILTGRDPAYGNKALALFQTSDCRHRSLTDLGNAATWVKWAQPTAEALRQACLARETRVSQSQPPMPASYVTALDVSNSTFLGPIYLQFNPQYTAFIGGRGTGKSSILEYLRWGLCDDQEWQDSDDIPRDQLRRRKLIEQTLRPVGATVQVHLLVNGVPHVVRRVAATHELSLRIAAGGFEPCKESDVRALLPVQAYSQKQLSSVGVRVEELRRFVNTPVRQTLEDIRGQLASTGNELRSAHARLRSKRQLENNLAADERELTSLDEQSATIRRELGGIGEADRDTLSLHPLVERESELVEQWSRDLARVRITLTQVAAALRAVPSHIAADTKELPHSAVVERMRSATVGAIEQTRRSIASAEAEFQAATDAVSEVSAATTEWRGLYGAFSIEYAAAKARSSAHQSKLDQLGQLESRSKVVRDRVSERRVQLEDAGTPELDVATARTQWVALHDRRFAVLEDQCRKLTESSDRLIKATLTRGGAAEALQERFRTIATGTGISKAKLEKLWEGMTANEHPIRFVQSLLDECEALSLSNAGGGESDIPAVALLRGAGMSDRELVKLAAKMTADIWLDLCVVPIEDQPFFQYRLRENDYIAFADASAGQQATALLWALLNQNGPPLLIDQPEDDLDNQVVLRVVEQIWRAKGGRQLMFASHNANVVVNGDADLVVCCDYRVEGEQAGGTIKYQGAIDVAEVREEIAVVMEGGRAAFRLRKDKYGF